MKADQSFDSIKLIPNQIDGVSLGHFRSPSRLLKNAHLLRFPHPSSLRSLQGPAGASILRISGALHLGIFEQPAENDFFSNCWIKKSNSASILRPALRDNGDRKSIAHRIRKIKIILLRMTFFCDI